MQVELMVREVSVCVGTLQSEFAILDGFQNAHLEMLALATAIKKAKVLSGLLSLTLNFSLWDLGEGGCVEIEPRTLNSFLLLGYHLHFCYLK